MKIKKYYNLVINNNLRLRIWLSVLLTSFFSVLFLVDIIFYPFYKSRQLAQTRITPNSRVFTVSSNNYSSFLGGTILIVKHKKDYSIYAYHPKFHTDFNHSYEKITGDILLSTFPKYRNTKKKKLTKQYIAARQLFCEPDDATVTIIRTLVYQGKGMRTIQNENILDCISDI